MASGLPDYYSASSPVRTGLRAGQEKWEVDVTATIPPGDTGAIPLYVVPAGKQLFISLIMGSFLQPGVGKGTLYCNGVTLGSYYLHVALALSTGDAGAYTLDAGDVFGFGVYNYMSFTSNIEARFSGTLVSV